MSRTFSANEQCFSLPTNQATVPFSLKSQMLQGTLVWSLSTVHEVIQFSVLKVVNRCLLEALLKFWCLISKGQTVAISVNTTRSMGGGFCSHGWCTKLGTATQLYLNVKCVWLIPLITPRYFLLRLGWSVHGWTSSRGCAPYFQLSAWVSTNVGPNCIISPF